MNEPLGPRRPRTPEELARGGGEPEPGGTGLYQRRSDVVDEAPFWSDLPGLFGYPFREGGIWTLLISAVLFAVLFGITNGARYFGFGGLILVALLSACLYGYIGAYFLHVAQRSANKEPDPPPWQDFSSFVENVREFARIFSIFFFPLILPLATYALIGYFSPGGVNPWILLVMALPGLFYVPMGLLTLAVTGNLGNALNPFFIFHSISRAPGAYSVVVFAFYLIYGLFALFQFVASFLPFSSVFFFALEFYFLMVIFRMLGLFYLQCQGRLGWYRAGS